MNLRQHLTATFLFILLFANAGVSQTYTGYKQLTLRSDFPAKTITVSNVNEKVGEKSPFLVAAIVNENESQKEFRSLLQFNYDYLPELVKTDPIRISSAELVLYPANSNFFENKKDETGKLVVRRIIENWFDSSTAWNNQPMVDTSTVAKEKVKIKGKNQEIRINVTLLVMDMILHGNKGFMISQNNPVATNTLTGLSFASSLNEEKLLRPLLIITYYEGGNSSPDYIRQIQNRPATVPLYKAPLTVPVPASSSNRLE